MQAYDFLIVGAGLYGLTFAREMKQAGASVLVIDKRDHIGGNCFTEKIENIDVHTYGPHIFHTDNKHIWRYFKQFGVIKPYRHTGKVFYDNKIYSFPINLMTLNQIYGSSITTPEDAEMYFLNMQSIEITKPQNFEEQLLSTIGRDLYEMFFENYTTKLWGYPPSELPAEFAKRLPVRYTMDDRYYRDTFVGVPEEGWTRFFMTMIDGIEVRLNTDFFVEKMPPRKHLIYTGRIDEYYDYKYGELDYRKIRFDTTTHSSSDYQGCAVLNFPEYKYDFVRRTEHKYFSDKTFNKTVITEEVPHLHGVPCYPVRNEKNLNRLALYQIETPHNVHFGGRLGTFRYISMDEVISTALEDAKLCRENF